MSNSQYEAVTTRRFHVDDVSPQIISVGGDQARHAIRVLRMKAGDSVVLFDGSGREAIGTIDSMISNSFAVRISHCDSAHASSDSRLILAVAPPKGSRADWLVEKCAEIGVAVLQPLVCERGQVVPRAAKLDRWRRKAIEAAKQSRRPVPMRIEEPLPLSRVLTSADPAANLFFADPDPKHPFLPQLLVSEKDNTPKIAMILVGPEGGFTATEYAQMEQHDGQAVRLNVGTLRVETAAVTAAAIWTAWHEVENTEKPVLDP